MWRSIVWVAVIASGCGPGTPSGGGSGGTDGGSGTPTDGHAGSADPVVQSFTVTPTIVHINTSMMFSAVVTDTAGVAALTGAVLVDPTTNGTYGSFATPGGQGTFELGLSWAQLIQVDPVSGPGTRDFTAKFFDQTSHETTASLSVTIACDAPGDTCDDDSQCYCGQQCDILDSIDYRCCVPPGGACTSDADCCVNAPDNPGVGYTCGANHTCEGFGWLEDGQTCLHPYDCSEHVESCPGPCPST